MQHRKARVRTAWIALNPSREEAQGACERPVRWNRPSEKSETAESAENGEEETSHECRLLQQPLHRLGALCGSVFFGSRTLTFPGYPVVGVNGFEVFVDLR